MYCQYLYGKKELSDQKQFLGGWINNMKTKNK